MLPWCVEPLLSRLRSFFTAWTRRDRFEDSLDEEVRFHLAACTADLIRSGLTGGVIGLACALGLGRVLQSVLYEVEHLPPAIIAASAAGLAAVALAAGFVPAHRASRVDPMEALRHK